MLNTLLSVENVTLASGVTSGLSIVTEIFGFITKNAMCMTLVGISLIPVGFKIFRSGKKAALK